MLKKSFVFKPSNKFSDAEDIIKCDVKMLLKDVIQKVVPSETSKKKSVSDESCSVLKCDKWQKKVHILGYEGWKGIHHVILFFIFFICFLVPFSFQSLESSASFFFVPMAQAIKSSIFSQTSQDF